jgi:predicted RNA binding protein YcfA (HicA-like mRNA interferase family)
MKQVSGKELVKIAANLGWSLNRINGSHHIMIKEGDATILTIPVHGNKPLKIGLLRALMKQAGINESDL